MGTARDSRKGGDARAANASAGDGAVGGANAAPAREPRQARSRETLTRLLDAAAALLSEQGREAATVPAIARRAGLSVGVVYRRFADKDALLRAVYERVHERFRVLNQRGLDSSFRELPLQAVLGAIVRGMVQAYRERRTLMKAMLQYAETHDDPAFRRRAAEVNARALSLFMEMVSARREEIRHPDGESAARFALMTAGLVLRGVLLADEPIPGLELGDGFALEEELTRMLLGYLRDPGAGTRPGR
jgi:AcrR family transcriptional regulator